MADFRCRPDCLLSEMDDGTGVVLSLPRSHYFTLNKAGVMMWKAVQSGTGDVDALAALLMKRFGILGPQARADVERFAAELGREGLLET